MSLLAALNLPSRSPDAKPSPGPDAETTRLKSDYAAKMKDAVRAAKAASDPAAKKAIATALATADRKRQAAEKAAEPAARADGLQEACGLLDAAIAAAADGASAPAAPAAKAAPVAPAAKTPVPKGASAPVARGPGAPAAAGPGAPASASSGANPAPPDEPKKSSDGISTKFNFDLSPKAREGKLGRYVNGKIGLKLEFSCEISALEADNKVKAGTTDSKDGFGFKGEIELVKGKFASTLMGSEFTEWKTSVGFELSTKKLDINAGVTFKIQTPISWLAAIGGVKFKFVEADWKKLSEEKAPTVAAVEISGGAQLERTIKPEDLGLTGAYKLKVTVKCTIAGQVSPDWTEVFSDVSKEVYEQGVKKAAEEAAKKTAQEAAKKAAEQAAKKAAQEAAKKAAQEAAKEAAATAAEGAGEVLVMDGAALASAAAAILLPAAAALAIGAGMIQEARNMKADSEAIATGLSTRTRASKAAGAYARVLTGGNASGEGAQEAESQIADMMKRANATREQAVEAIKKAKGGYADIRAGELKRIKDKLYGAACQAFDDGHKGDFGFLENRGETWGFRGSFRKMLSLILYADD